jgi:DNA modification methylase
MIAAYVFVGDDVNAEIAEIDENLQRQDLTVLEQAQHLKRREELLIEVGLRAPSHRPEKGDTVTPFKTTQDIGVDVGLSERAVHRRLQIAKNVDQDVQNMLFNTEVADSTTQLLDIARMDTDAQKLVAEMIVVGDAKTVEQAQKKMNYKIKEQRAIEEIKSKTKIRPRIINADCMSLINIINDIDLLVADPPYFTDGDFTNQISVWLSKVKDTGQAYIFCSSDPKELSAYFAINSHHMQIEQLLVWNYNNTGQRQPNRRYISNYQACLYYRGPMALDINKPPDGKKQYACQTINAPDGRVGDRYHSWQKPLELIERLILNSSNPGDFIFDPFAGTGTTLIAAAKNGRRAVGCDIDKSAVDICVKRGCYLEL